MLAIADEFTCAIRRGEVWVERSIDWDGAILAIDQRRLPQEYVVLRIETIDELVAAIRGLAIRGAPALGVAGALGVALSCQRHCTGAELDRAAVRADASRLAAARPTAVNLRWGVERALACLDGGPDRVLTESLALAAEDERVNRAAAQRAADLLCQIAPDRPLRLLTHCNTGRLATAGWGTALGAIRVLADSGRVESVLVTETRPLLQGARLTTWELAEAGIQHRLCVDSAAAAAMAVGQVDAVLVGADRVAANGDVANKIGTYSLALAAAWHAVPFLVVAPESTVDPETPHGGHIVIEQRPADEVTMLAGLPSRTQIEVFNPAFDVTPAELITAVVTEKRTISPGVSPDQAPRLAAAARGMGG